MLTILILIYVVFISLGLPDSVFGVVWPVLHHEFGLAESFASVYSLIIGLCSCSASFVAGIVLRRLGTPRVTLFSILLTAAGLVGMSYAPNIWVMILCAVGMGYGAGAIDTGLNNFVSLHYKARHMSWLHAFWGIGVTLSPVILSFFLRGEGGAWRDGYRLLALIQLCIAGAVAAALPKWLRVDKAENARITAEAEKGKTDFFAIKGLVSGILSLGFCCSMEYIVGTWGASYAVNSFSVGADAAARWISVYYGGVVAGRLANGFVAERLGDDRVIRIGSLVAGCGTLVLLLPIGSRSLFGLLLLGIGLAPIFPTVLHAIPERFGEAYSADIIGFHVGGAYAMGFLAQISIGYVATGISFRTIPYVLAALLLCLMGFNELTIRRVAASAGERA